MAYPRHLSGDSAVPTAFRNVCEPEVIPGLDVLGVRRVDQAVEPHTQHLALDDLRLLAQAALASR
ncbi:MAG: hypothetical protein H6741_07235 [Alphaproteobacteria bacterium]|nr:hypothetical protein [Alphaproteobacteria bacterium]